MFSSTLRWNCNLPIFSWKDLSNLFVCCCIKVKKYVLFYLFVYSSIYFIRFSMNMHLQSLALLVGLDGLEPSTSRLSGVRSNHLSYRPLFLLGVFSSTIVLRLFKSVVEMMGFEPMTPCLQGRCSPNWATPPCGVYLSLKEHFVIPENRTTIAIVGFAKSRRPWSLFLLLELRKCLLTFAGSP